jgi:hypothetical protein
MYAMRYGALPIAHKVGGLAETIRDGQTGFLFSRFEDGDLLHAVRRAVRALGDAGRRTKMMRAAMKQDFSWTESVAAYARLYRGVLKRPARTLPLAEAAKPAVPALRDAEREVAAPIPDSVRHAAVPGGAQVALIAQGPRRLYSYWQAGREAAPMAAPHVECRETGEMMSIGGSMPVGDGWIPARPSRHYRVVLGALTTEWVRTPPEVRGAPSLAASENLWALYLGPLGPTSSRRI